MKRAVAASEDNEITAALEPETVDAEAMNRDW
jgi:hypothetical protein